MKLPINNILIPEELANFALQEMQSQAIPSFSTYVCDLIRERRQQQIDEDLALLKRATADISENEPGPEFWNGLYQEVHNARNQRKKAA